MQGLIQQTFIDELLTSVDIVEFIDSYIPLKKRGINFIACCPFHNEKTPSFNVSKKNQFYHCFGCNASGNVIGFAMNYLQQTFPNAVETIASKVGMKVIYEKSDKSNNVSFYELLKIVTKFYQQALKSEGIDAINYLKQRDISGEIVKKYQIGYAPEGWQVLEKKFPLNIKDLLTTGMLISKDSGKVYDRYRNRIMFPIHNRHGKIIGFGGRSLTDSQNPKYLNSPETILFQKNRELYGLYQVLQNNNSNQNIIVVEGYLDVIALAQRGVLNVVASLGTATSPYHIQLLSKYTKEIIFCFDGDNAGRQAAWRALESTLPYLEQDLSAKFAFLPEGDDPDSLIRKFGKEYFLDYINKDITLYKIYFETLLKDIDMSTHAGKTKLLAKSKPYLLKIADGPYKDLLVNELSKLTRIDNHRIIQLTNDKTNNILDEAPKDYEVSRTPLRIAIAILLQQPSIYFECGDAIKNIKLNTNSQRVLIKIIEQISQRPGINTAILVELWRNTPLFNTINELAGWDHKVPKAALMNELVETILFIAKQDEENKIQILIEKSRKMSLTETEREELQMLLKKRHRVC